MRDITRLHPRLWTLAVELIKQCAAEGLPVLITETLRTVEEQEALYAKGRTAPGAIVTNARGRDNQSMHQWGVAFDFCRNVKGREFDDSDGFFRRVGAIGKGLGLFWGGDFKSIKDKPHFQMPEFSPDGTTAFLRKEYGSPDKFIKTWEDNDMTVEKFEELYNAMMERRGKLPPRYTGATGEEYAAAVAAGVSDGSRPQATATREEATLMAERAARNKQGDKQ